MPRFTARLLPNGWSEVWDSEQATEYDYYRDHREAREVADSLNRHVKPMQYIMHPIKCAWYRELTKPINE